MRQLSKEQQRALLHKYLTGDFPGQKWSTVKALITKGMLLKDGKSLVVTRKGAGYCNSYHLQMG